MSYGAPMADDVSAPLAVVDIDGVVADVRHRLHHLQRRPKDWDRFFAAADADPPHAEGIAVVTRLAAEHDVVFLTGRPDWLKEATAAWLVRHGLGGHQLVMRPPGDRRPAAQVKVEALRHLAAGRPVAVVVDDDDLVLEAMEAAGFPTFRADWESRPDDADEALRSAQEAEGRT